MVRAGRWREPKEAARGPSRREGFRCQSPRGRAAWAWMALAAPLVHAASRAHSARTQLLAPCSRQLRTRLLSACALQGLPTAGRRTTRAEAPLGWAVRRLLLEVGGWRVVSGGSKAPAATVGCRVRGTARRGAGTSRAPLPRLPPSCRPSSAPVSASCRNAGPWGRSLSGMRQRVAQQAGLCDKEGGTWGHGLFSYRSGLVSLPSPCHREPQRAGGQPWATRRLSLGTRGQEPGLQEALPQRACPSV